MCDWDCDMGSFWVVGELIICEFFWCIVLVMGYGCFMVSDEWWC